MNNPKDEFYRVLNEIVGAERLSDEEAYIINDYVSRLEATHRKEQKEIERLRKIARKMHLWIFLHSSDEQKVYDELGLTDEENAMLGYSGQFRIKEKSDTNA